MMVVFKTGRSPSHAGPAATSITRPSDNSSCKPPPEFDMLDNNYQI